jgi:hypothetical protein
LPRVKAFATLPSLEEPTLRTVIYNRLENLALIEHEPEEEPILPCLLVITAAPNFKIEKPIQLRLTKLLGAVQIDQYLYETEEVDGRGLKGEQFTFEDTHSSFQFQPVTGNDKSTGQNVAH